MTHVSSLDGTGFVPDGIMIAVQEGEDILAIELLNALVVEQLVDEEEIDWLCFVELERWRCRQPGSDGFGGLFSCFCTATSLALVPVCFIFDMFARGADGDRFIVDAVVAQYLCDNLRR